MHTLISDLLKSPFFLFFFLGECITNYSIKRPVYELEIEKKILRIGDYFSVKRFHGDMAAMSFT